MFSSRRRRLAGAEENDSQEGKEKREKEKALGGSQFPGPETAGRQAAGDGRVDFRASVSRSLQQNR